MHRRRLISQFSDIVQVLKGFTEDHTKNKFGKKVLAKLGTDLSKVLPGVLPVVGPSCKRALKGRVKYLFVLEFWVP